MPGDIIKSEIAAELCKALERLGAPAELLAIVGSYGDTLSDEEVLEYLRAFNEGGTMFGKVQVLPGAPKRKKIRPRPSQGARPD